MAIILRVLAWTVEATPVQLRKALMDFQSSDDVAKLAFADLIAKVTHVKSLLLRGEEELVVRGAGYAAAEEEEEDDEDDVTRALKRSLAAV